MGPQAVELKKERAQKSIHGRLNTTWHSYDGAGKEEFGFAMAVDDEDGQAKTAYRVTMTRDEATRLRDTLNRSLVSGVHHIVVYYTTHWNLDACNDIGHVMFTRSRKSQPEILEEARQLWLVNRGAEITLLSAVEQKRRPIPKWVTASPGAKD